MIRPSTSHKRNSLGITTRTGGDVLIKKPLQAKAGVYQKKNSIPSNGSVIPPLQPTTTLASASVVHSTMTRPMSASALYSMTAFHSSVGDKKPPEDQEDLERLPSEVIFNTHFTQAGRIFLNKVKHNRSVLQVQKNDHRKKAFQEGLEKKTVVFDPILQRHYRVLIIDFEIQRREKLADCMEKYVEIFIATNIEKALDLFGSFTIDLVLARMSPEKGAGIELQKEMIKKHIKTPIAYLVHHAVEQEKMLQHAITLGACGYFEDGLPQVRFMDRLIHLLRSFSIAQAVSTLPPLKLTALLTFHKEYSRTTGKPMPKDKAKKEEEEEEDFETPRGGHHRQNNNNNDGNGNRRQSIESPSKVFGANKTPNTTGIAPPHDPSVPITHDAISDRRNHILMELSIHKRKASNLEKKCIDETIAKNHSVLGIELQKFPITPSISSLSASGSMPALLLEATSKTSTTHQQNYRAMSIVKKIAPPPTAEQVSKQIYAKPHELQAGIHRHLYETYNASKSEPLPQDPLLVQCIAVDPHTISPTASILFVGKAYHLYQEKRYDESISLCDRSIKTQRNNLVKFAYLLRGVLFDLMGDYAKAERDFTSCINLDTTISEAYFNRSVVLLKRAKDEAALDDVSKAITLNPMNNQYLHNRALMHRRMGHFDLAHNEYARMDALHAYDGSSSGGGTARGGDSSGWNGSTTSSQAHGSDNMSTISTGASSISKTAPDPTGALQHFLNACHMDTGIFDHLFGRPPDDKFALVCPPHKRTPEMIEMIVARLREVNYFEDFPTQLLERVAQLMEYQLISTGKHFEIGEEHPEHFYIVLEGNLSVRRQIGELPTSVTKHHIPIGLPFGCTGETIAVGAKLVAEITTEIGFLPFQTYEATIRTFCMARYNEMFRILHHLRAFKRLSVMQLGYMIGISEKMRFRKGEVILHQHETPRHLFILWKGTCSVYQDFSKPSSTTVKETKQQQQQQQKDEEEDEVEEEEESEKRSLPYHHLLAKSDWPLGFNTKSKSRSSHSRKNAFQTEEAIEEEHRRRELLEIRQASTLKNMQKNVLVSTLSPHSLFGETGLSHHYDPNGSNTKSKCTIVADCIVEVLCMDYMRLKEMDLEEEFINDMLAARPKYLEAKQMIQQKFDTKKWEEYKNLRMLEISKKRWPEAQKNVRMLANGCSIYLGDFHKKPNSSSATAGTGAGATSSSSVEDIVSVIQ